MGDAIDGDPHAYLARQYRRIEEIAATAHQALLAYEAGGHPSYNTMVTTLQTSYDGPVKTMTPHTPTQRTKIRQLIAHASKVAQATQNLSINKDIGSRSKYRDPHTWVGIVVAVLGIAILITVIVLFILTFS